MVLTGSRRADGLVRSYSLASCPDTESEHKVTVKRVDEGRISNLFNDALALGDSVMVIMGGTYTRKNTGAETNQRCHAPAGLFLTTGHEAWLFPDGPYKAPPEMTS